MSCTTINNCITIYLLNSFTADDEDGEEEEGKTSFDKLTMPENVISLDAHDDFLRERVMNLPETVVANTHNTEEGLMKRLTQFRGYNTADATVLNYFDDLEIHPEHIGEFTCT